MYNLSVTNDTAGLEWLQVISFSGFFPSWPQWVCPSCFQRDHVGPWVWGYQVFQSSVFLSGCCVLGGKVTPFTKIQRRLVRAAHCKCPTILKPLCLLADFDKHRFPTTNGIRYPHKENCATERLDGSPHYFFFALITKWKSSSSILWAVLLALFFWNNDQHAKINSCH